MNCKFLRQEDDKIYFDGVLMEIYIPKEYIANETAYFMGDKFCTLGIFDFIVYTSEDRKTSNSSKFILKLPTNIQFEFSEYFQTKTSLQKDNSDEKDYYVFVLTNGMLFSDNNIKEKDANAAKNFIFNFHNGKISKDVKYLDIINLYLDNIMINGVGLENKAVMFEMIIAVLSRYKEDETLQFRYALNKYPNLSQYDYDPMNILKVPSNSSTFAGLMFQDINNAVNESILREKTGRENLESPFEEVIKY